MRRHPGRHRRRGRVSLRCDSRRSGSCLLFGIVLVVALAAMTNESIAARADEAHAAVDEDWFVEKVEPILRERCYGCHSHASRQMEGELALDSRSGWSDGGSRGAAIVPGQPDRSLLFLAVSRQAEDEDLAMPPDEPLSEPELAVIKAWILAGAPDPRTIHPSTEAPDPLDWWSLQPLAKPELPLEREGQHPIDAWVEAKLQAEGLAAVQRADRRTLIRRLYVDLHGLPPSREQVDAFVNDPDPQAFDKLVDRLLASPRYGERWARHWLDTIHFADSHGCEHDLFRPHAWRYRDYLIDSLNRDKSWATFVREQLAADWFWPERTDLTSALGFLAAGPLELSRAGTAPITFDYLDRDDIVTQVMAAFTSTTANCARCHDHKFDPVSQEDYYALQAVFAGGGKGDLDYDLDPDVHRQRTKWQTLLAAAEVGTDAEHLLASEYASLVSAWEASHAKQSVQWRPLQTETFVSSEGVTLERLSDGSLLAREPNPATDSYTVQGTSPTQRVTAIRLDLLPHESLPEQGPGRAGNGNLHLNEFSVFLFDTQTSISKPIPITRAVADWNQEGWTIAHAIDGNPATAWGIYPKVGQPHVAVFPLDPPLAMQDASRLVVQLKQSHGGSHLIGRFKLSVTDAGDPAGQLLPDAVSDALRVPAAERSQVQQLTIASHVLARHAQSELDRLPTPVTVYGWSAGYSHAKKLPEPMQPKKVHVLTRGNIDKPGAEAHPGSLSAIDWLPSRFPVDPVLSDAARRGALADWIADSENPLTWRSVVNRVWAYHFGRGLSDTPNDLGRMGASPSHPELIDWLAVWFRDDAGGSLKQLHRLILTSETWQRSSRLGAASSDRESWLANDKADQGNRLLWRHRARAMDAESYRDALLQIAGRLDSTMGGPGVQQFLQTQGQQSTPKLDYEAFDWNAPGAGRRSVYRVVWRGIPDPFMESLDFPDLGVLAPKRETSVSPLQALTRYNDDFVLHHCQVLANDIAAEQETVHGQTAEAVCRILLREPSDQEREELEPFVQTHGLAALCRVLFNTNEFVMVD